MKLYCHSEYRNGALGLHFEQGRIEVADELGAFLMRDAPENFEIVPLGWVGVTSATPQEAIDNFERSMDAPPQDKAVKKPTRKKAAA